MDTPKSLRLSGRQRLYHVGSDFGLVRPNAQDSAPSLLLRYSPGTIPTCSLNAA